MVRKATIVRADATGTLTVVSSDLVPDRAAQTTVTLPAARVRALLEAEAIRAQARADADAIVARALEESAKQRTEALSDARREASAALAHERIALEQMRATWEAASVERLADVALLVAERLIGQAIAIDGAHLRTLTQEALRAAQGAASLRIDAHADDVAEVRAALAALPHLQAEVTADTSLSRGSLVLHMDRGVVDARIDTQLERLRASVRSILRG